jgi:hypothetical protein
LLNIAAPNHKNEVLNSYKKIKRHRPG